MTDARTVGRGGAPGPGPGPDAAAWHARAPHLVAAATVLLVVGAALWGGATWAVALERRYAHALAPRQFHQKDRGTALQRAAFTQADLLPVYGSSELQTLEATGVPGYTEMPKMVGRGRHIRHFDNPVWPGATGAVFTVILPEEARTKLLPPFEALAASLETRSHGLYGLHIFALPCEQII